MNPINVARTQARRLSRTIGGLRTRGYRRRVGWDRDPQFWRRLVREGAALPPRRPDARWRDWVNRALVDRAQVDGGRRGGRRLRAPPAQRPPRRTGTSSSPWGPSSSTRPRRTPSSRWGPRRYSRLLPWLALYEYRDLEGIDLVFEAELRGRPDPLPADGPDRDDVPRSLVRGHRLPQRGGARGRHRSATSPRPARLLRPGGVLVTSTDFWCEPVDVAGLEAYGGPVRIFGPDDLAGLAGDRRPARPGAGAAARPPLRGAGRHLGAPRPPLHVRQRRPPPALTGAVRGRSHPPPPPRPPSPAGARSGAPSACCRRRGTRPRCAVGRALRDLVTGRPPESWRARPGEPPLDPRRVEEARRALDEGRLDEALAAAAAILASHPRTIGALEIRQAALLRAGEPTASLAALRSLRRIGDTAERADLDRRLVGMLRESDPGWLPRIPGPPDPIAPAAPGRVLHLLKESPPDRQSGFAMRSHHILAAQRAAGLDPVAVTALGFPRAAGRVAPAVETIDGIRMHRLDLGAGYPADVPLDRYLEDFAWLASGVVHAERPAILHAASGLRGYDMALVGLALRARHDLPLVYEVRSFLETSWSGREGAELAEISRRRQAAETRAMTEADAVVTIAEAMREDVVARGVPPERVFVAPNGVDAEQFAPRPPDAALRAAATGSTASCSGT